MVELEFVRRTKEREVRTGQIAEIDVEVVQIRADIDSHADTIYNGRALITKREVRRIEYAYAYMHAFIQAYLHTYIDTLLDVDNIGIISCSDNTLVAIDVIKYLITNRSPSS